MENSTPSLPTPSSLWERTPLAFELFFKNLGKFGLPIILLTLFNFLMVYFGFSYLTALVFLAAPVWQVVALGVGIGLLSFLVDAFFVVAFIHTAKLAADGKSFSFGEMFSFAGKKFWLYVRTILWIFVWTGMWIPFILVLISSAASAFFTTAMEGSCTAWQIQQGICSAGPALMITNFVLLGATLVAWVFVVERSLRAGLAVYAVGSEENLNTAREAVRESASLVKDRWWRTFGNFLFFGAVLAVFSFVILFFVGFLGDPFSMQVQIIQQFIDILFTVLMIVFGFLLFSAYKQEGKILPKKD